MLITMGSEQGCVWVLTGEGASPAEEDPVGFLDWLEQWIADSSQVIFEVTGSVFMCYTVFLRRKNTV
jgi:hypothetical protein